MPYADIGSNSDQGAFRSEKPGIECPVLGHFDFQFETGSDGSCGGARNYFGPRDARPVTLTVAGIPPAYVSYLP